MAIVFPHSPASGAPLRQPAPGYAGGSFAHQNGDWARFAEILAQRQPVADGTASKTPVGSAHSDRQGLLEVLKVKAVEAILGEASDRSGAGPFSGPDQISLASMALHPAISFIDGSLFGHATELVGTGAPPASEAAGSGSSARVNSFQPVSNQDLPIRHETAEISDQIAGSSTFAEAIVPAVQGLGAVLPVIGISSAVTISAREGLVVTTAQGVSTGFALTAMPAFAPASGNTSFNRQEGPDNSPMPTSILPEARDRPIQAAGLSQVNVTAAMGSDGSGLRILVRIADANVDAENQVENIIRAAVWQSGGKVGQLRLNGIDRIHSVGT